MSIVLPWDCVVTGVSAPLQSSTRKRTDWRARVGAAARMLWPATEPPLDAPLALTVAFLHTGESVDVDNMLKPTVDALSGICYSDDRWVEQILGLRGDLRAGLRTDGLSVVLASALVATALRGGPFVYLRLTRPTDLEELLR